ncbi:MAG: ABC transporter ATP-binding protein/permease [Paludibacteraceae bacterium]|nr:ABC transporter ATP-binding protein/permease [Paludibacteraceae bacterium]
MKTPSFINLIKRFVGNYKRYVGLNFLFNILSTIFSLFSFALIIPILNILFKIEQVQYAYQPVDWNDLAGSLKNNAYWWMQQFIADNGGVMTLALLGAFLVVMTMFKTGTAYLASYYIIPLRSGVVRDLRQKLYEKIVDLNLGFFHKHKKGDIIARMTSDVNEVEASIMSSIEMLTKNPIMIIIYFGVLLWLSWKLTLFVLVVLPFAGTLMGKVGKSLKRKSQKVQTQMGQLLSQIEETLGGLRVVKAFNAEDSVTHRFEEMNNDLRKTTNSMQRRNMLAHPMSEFLGTATIAIVLVFGGMVILEGGSSLDASAFIYYLIIFYSIINPAKDLSKAWYSIEKGRASMERIDTVLQANNPLKVVENPVPLKPFSDKIEFRNVSFKYEDQWVLKHINLTIEKGKTIALVGQSGSGKSTLVDLLPRFYDVQEGEVLIDGVNVKDMALADLRTQMGNVNQEAILFNDTIANNITFGTKGATQESIENSAKIANAHNFIMETEDGYNTNIGDRGERLSGGQRQRLSIARAILKNPPILILDEATSALDTESEKLVQGALEHLMKNRTTIVIAHRLSTIRNADEICVLNEGEIVERGKHEELIAKNGIYKKLCDMQSF